MENLKDKFAPKNAQELDHWHVPQNLEIDENHFYQQEKDESST